VDVLIILFFIGRLKKEKEDAIAYCDLSSSIEIENHPTLLGIDVNVECPLYIFDLIPG
jgi:hypothetical protein